VNLIFLIIGLCLCTLTTTIFLVFKTKKNGLTTLFSKTIASFCFIMLAVFLSFSKNQVGYYASMPICLIIIGLVSSLVGNMIFELKAMYEFHQKQYLNFGIASFSIAQIFNIVAILTFVNTQTNLSALIISISIIALVSAILTFVYWIISSKLLKLKYKNHTILSIIYCFLILFVTILTCYFAIVLKNYYMLILALAFVLMSICSTMFSTQFFGNKEMNKTHIISSLATYYIAQVLISTFIYFI